MFFRNTHTKKKIPQLYGCSHDSIVVLEASVLIYSLSFTNRSNKIFQVYTQYINLLCCWLFFIRLPSDCKPCVRGNSLVTQGSNQKWGRLQQGFLELSERFTQQASFLHCALHQWFTNFFRLRGTFGNTEFFLQHNLCS